MYHKRVPRMLRMDKWWVRWIAGAAFWTLVGLFYATRGMAGGAGPGQRAVMIQWYLWGLLTPLIVRVDARLPLPREAFFQRALMHVPLGLLFTVAFVYLNAAARDLFDLPGERFAFSPDLLRNAFAGPFHWHVQVYFVIIALYTAYKYYASLKERQIQTAELERLLAQSRLNALRAQLNPHFLFNALNTISAHVEHNPRVARRMLEQLGELLRMSLDYSEEQMIPLSQELAFLDRYLAIQKARFEDRLNVVMEIESGVEGMLVPTFVLQPIVENAVQHAISPRSDPGRLRIGAAKDGAGLRLEVEDDGPGMPQPPSVSKGVGLANTKERLRRLYGDSGHRFDIISSPGQGALVRLWIPERDSPSEALPLYAIAHADR